MFKKLLYVCCAGALLSTAACSSEDVVPASEQESLVSFTVELPADAQSRSRAVYGDGLTALNLQWQVYDEAGVKMNVQGTTTFTDRVATVTMRLANSRKYNILFWASAADCPYTFDADAKTVTVDYTDVTAQDERHDAFFAHYEMPAAVSGSISETIYLYRPFAQVNIGATDATDAANAGWETETTQVTISKAYKTLNLYTGEVTDPVEVVYAYADKPAATETFPASVAAEYQSMVYVLTESSSNLVDVKFEAQDNSDVITRTYANVPVQRNYRTNIYGRILTEEANFNVEIVPGFNEPANDVPVYEMTASTPAQAQEALTSNATNVILHLSEAVSNITIDCRPWVGQICGADTENLVIEGQVDAEGNPITTLTFNNIDSDWNQIGLVNPNGKIILRNVKLSNTGYNNGPWNRHDIHFRNNEVLLENVVSDKAIALDNCDATLRKVTISDVGAGEEYGLWITADGQTVVIEDCFINMSEGIDRAIAIKDQYVATPQSVNLTVTGTKFVSGKKGAILVTNTAGANITWGENNDVSGVAALASGTIAPIWNDSDRTAAWDLITINGETGSASSLLYQEP